MRKAEKWNSEIGMNKCMRKVKRLFVYSSASSSFGSAFSVLLGESHVERGQTRQNKVNIKR